MKKIKIIALFFIGMVLLVSCTTKEMIGVCEETVEDMNRLRMEFYAKDDKVFGYKIMFGFNQNLFKGQSEIEIEETIERELGLAESPKEEISVGFDHLDNYSFVSVHFKDLNKISNEDFNTMGISNSIELNMSLNELINTEANDGIKCWIEQ